MAWEILQERVAAIRRNWCCEKPLKGHAIFVIQHLLDDLVHLLNRFVDLGIQASDITVIGIPYSSRPDAGQAVASLVGTENVLLPHFFPFDGPALLLFLERLATCRQAGKRLILLEDGGYLVTLVSQLAAAKKIDLSVVKGAVEQTTRGIDLDNLLEQEGILALPVVSVPACYTKKRIEPTFIADAVLENLQLLLSEVEVGWEARIKTVGVFGFGMIGKAVARHFAERGKRVYVEETRRMEALDARGEGFIPLRERVKECDLVLGATGRRSIDLFTLRQLKDGAFVGSTSSRQIEIDVEWLKGAGRELGRGRAGPTSMGIPFFRKFAMESALGGSEVTLLYDGYPVNFSGTSLPEHAGDAVLSLLLEGVVTVARRSLPHQQVYNDVLWHADGEIYSQWSTLNPDEAKRIQRA